MALIDDIIQQVDGALRTLAGSHGAQRLNPATDIPEALLNADEQKHAAGLMRVNHSGEICAQALYKGQALSAKDTVTRASLLAAAQEETDHLAWCEERLDELDSKPSVLNPMFYAASYAMGAVTGLLGDKVSLGFVEATEDQVCRHLESHLDSLPDEDLKSRRIVQQMHEDEARHGANALQAGGTVFPTSLKIAMTLISRVMTKTTYNY